MLNAKLSNESHHAMDLSQFRVNNSSGEVLEMAASCHGGHLILKKKETSQHLGIDTLII